MQFLLFQFQRTLKTIARFQFAHVCDKREAAAAEERAAHEAEHVGAGSSLPDHGRELVRQRRQHTLHHRELRTNTTRRICNAQVSVEIRRTTTPWVVILTLPEKKVVSRQALGACLRDRRLPHAARSTEPEAGI